MFLRQRQKDRRQEYLDQKDLPGLPMSSLMDLFISQQNNELEKKNKRKKDPGRRVGKSGRSVAAVDTNSHLNYKISSLAGGCSLEDPHIVTL